MSLLIAELLGSQPIVTRKAGAPIPVDHFLRGNTTKEQARNLDYWRCELFRGIGCAHAAAVVARRLLAEANSNEEKTRALHYLGLALFHRGKYKRSAKAYLKAASLSTDEDRRRQLFDAVEALRCGGSSSRASKYLLDLELECRDPRYLPQILVRQLLLTTQRVEFLRSTYRTQRADELAAAADPLIARLQASASKEGAQVELAQCEDLRRRLGGFQKQVSTPSQELLSAVDRFHQLGFVVAKASALRREFLEGPTVATGTDLTGLVDLLDRIGAAAEAWKFGLTTSRLLRGRIGAARTLRVVKNNLICQYTVKHRLARIAQSVRESVRLASH